MGRKKDWKYWLYGSLKWICWLILPLTLLIWKFTTAFGEDGGEKFVINSTVYVGILIALIFAKKLLLKNYFTRLQGHIVNYETSLTIETDQSKLANIQLALGKSLAISDAVNAGEVILILALSYQLIQAIEAKILVLANVFLCGILVYFVGLIFAVLFDTSVKSKNYTETTDSSSTSSTENNGW